MCTWKPCGDKEAGAGAGLHHPKRHLSKRRRRSAKKVCSRNLKISLSWAKLHPEFCMNYAQACLLFINWLMFPCTACNYAASLFSPLSLTTHGSHLALLVVLHIGMLKKEGGSGEKWSLRPEGWEKLSAWYHICRCSFTWMWRYYWI